MLLDLIPLEVFVPVGKFSKAFYAKIVSKLSSNWGFFLFLESFQKSLIDPNNIVNFILFVKNRLIFIINVSWERIMYWLLDTRHLCVIWPFSSAIVSTHISFRENNKSCIIHEEKSDLSSKESVFNETETDP